MSRWIDKDAFIADARMVGLDTAEKVLFALAHQPSIDICFCRECKHGEYREDYDDYLCRSDGISVHDADWFCADGERGSGKPNNSTTEDCSTVGKGRSE